MSIRVTITGGLGFIGAHLVHRLVSNDNISKVVVLDLHKSWPLSHEAISNSPKVEFVTGDVVNQALTENCVCGSHYIYHLAAESHVENSIWEPATAVQSNVLGTFSVLEAIRRHGGRLILASTSEVYGSVAKRAISVNSPLEPYSPYAATKVAADRLTAAYVRTYGIDAAIGRMFNVFGPGQYYEKVIPMFICSTLCGLPMPIQGDGRAVRDWSYVDTMCGRLLSLAYNPGPLVRNLASGDAISVREIGYEIAKIADIGLPDFYRLPERAGHVTKQFADVSPVLPTDGMAHNLFVNRLRTTFEWYEARIDHWRDDFLKTYSALVQIADSQHPQFGT